MKSRVKAFRPFRNLSRGLEEGQSGAEIDRTVELTSSRAVGCNEWTAYKTDVENGRRQVRRR